ncbi:MlaD family protein [Pontibacter sp. G13]|uniref:MlaD family protein n=1 Tax=Pontibacter sp. G13 TaxID=3074898 RepID=UPI0028894C45|nr:MlaD family protein [Pontibacter sp. G13]WNJ19517.1 MlaD family protein [Pontibacter sp. G13]
MTREIKVGLTVLLGVLMIYLLIAWTQRLHIFAPSAISYPIRFEQVNGLLVGDPVQVRGYQVGRVEAIQPFSDRVVVWASVDESLQVQSDATAEIQIKELMGGKQIELFLGSSATPWTSGSELIGRASPDFSTGFSMAGDMMTQMSEVNVQQLMGRVDSLGGYAQSMAAEIDPRLLGQMMVQLSQTVSRLDRWTAELDRQIKPEQVAGWMNRMDSLATVAERVAGRVDDWSAEIENSGLIGQVDTVLDQSSALVGELRGLTQEMEGLLADAQDERSFVGKALQDPQFATQVDSLVIRLNAVLQQIQSDKIIVGFSKRKKKEEASENQPPR